MFPEAIMGFIWWLVSICRSTPRRRSELTRKRERESDRGSTAWLAVNQSQIGSKVAASDVQQNYAQGRQPDERSHSNKKQLMGNGSPRHGWESASGVKRNTNSSPVRSRGRAAKGDERSTNRGQRSS